MSWSIVVLTVVLLCGLHAPPYPPPTLDEDREAHSLLLEHRRGRYAPWKNTGYFSNKKNQSNL